MSKKSLFQCPVCAKALLQGEKQYFCRSGHSFDIARKGYVNLLLPSHTGSGDPGDSKEMIGSRKEFLNKGYYEKFSDRLNEILTEGIPDTDKSDSISILDAGCGEGYYTWRIKNRLAALGYSEKADIYGIDVSKAAIHNASGGDKSVRFAVASTYHIPVMPGSIDYIMCIFAPRDEGEFKRILKPSGKVIVAAPGARHLFSLRRLLYGETDPIGQKGTMGGGFKQLKHANVSYEVRLECNRDILNLLRMTPYSRHTNQAAEANIKKLDELTIEVDFNIRVYQKE